jgi:cytochrome c
MSQAPTRPDAGRETAQLCKPSIAGPACAGSGICWFRILLFLGVIALFALTAVMNAGAAEAGRGRQLAQEHCAACHAIAPPGRSEVADAPPFATIAGKYGHDAGAILHAIAGPHPKMNFSPPPAVAADIAAYIATLKP